jgi:glycosyltransferase involved in cell wall biosynthesis
MVAGCFAQAGYFMGTDLYEARESNPKGFFESPTINSVNEEILDTIPESYYTFRPIFGHRWTAAILPEFIIPDHGQPVDRIQEVVRRVPFCFKDPRFSYTLPVWRPYLSHVAFICVFREPDNTAVSLVRETNSVRFDSGIPTYLTHAQALNTWYSIYAAILRMDRSRTDWLFVHYDQVLDGSALDAVELLAETKLDRSFPQRSLRRSVGSPQSQAPEIQRMYATLCGLSNYGQADRAYSNRDGFEDFAKYQRSVARGDMTTGAPQRAIAGPKNLTRRLISAVVLTKNGAGRLDSCLQSIIETRVADEIVVCVDGTTTDETIDIARRFTRNVYVLRTQGYIESSLREMASLCGGKLILRVDDDELLAGNWADKDLEAFAGINEVTHFWIPRRWIVPPGNRFICSQPWFPDLQLRLFRSDSNAIVWPTRIHDPLSVPGRGLVLADRWIDHYDLVISSRQTREIKCRNYQFLRPEKHLSQFYLWEDEKVQLCPTTVSGFREAIESARPQERTALLKLRIYEIGADIVFQIGGNAIQYQGSGWSHPEPWGTWTDGYRAELLLPFRETCCRAMTLRVDANAYLTPEHPALRVSVVCWPFVAGEWLIGTREFIERSLPLPAFMISGRNELYVTFHILNPASPSEFGESSDGRVLGLGVRKISLDFRD